MVLVATGTVAILAAQTPAPSAPEGAPADLSAPPADAVQTDSGLTSRMVTPGTSDERPAPTDFVTVQYTGWSADGTVVDSTWRRGEPSMIALDQTLPGWGECVQMMTVGEIRRCWMPQELAYDGRAGQPTGTMVFDIELIETHAAPTVPPLDVAEPPADATRTVSGLVYKVLKAGAGTRRPSPRSRVTVHYTGWTPDERDVRQLGRASHPAGLCGRRRDSRVDRGPAAHGRGRTQALLDSAESGVQR